MRLLPSPLLPCEHWGNDLHRRQYILFPSHPYKTMTVFCMACEAHKSFRMTLKIPLNWKFEAESNVVSKSKFE